MRLLQAAFLEVPKQAVPLAGFGKKIVEKIEPFLPVPFLIGRRDQGKHQVL